jgi:hypothetical protein
LGFLGYVAEVLLSRELLVHLRERCLLFRGLLLRFRKQQTGVELSFTAGSISKYSPIEILVLHLEEFVQPR